VEDSDLSRGPPAARLLARGQAASLNTRLGLGLAVAVFLVFRITTLVTSLETVSVDEELHHGTIARELGAGLTVSFWDHLADPYSGGSLIVGLAAWGLGWGIREALKEDLVRTQDWLSRLRPSDREAALAGVLAYDHLYRPDARR
jgi:hypothetical protein